MEGGKAHLEFIGWVNEQFTLKNEVKPLFLRIKIETELRHLNIKRGE